MGDKKSWRCNEGVVAFPASSLKRHTIYCRAEMSIYIYMAGGESKVPKLFHFKANESHH